MVLCDLAAEPEDTGPAFKFRLTHEVFTSTFVVTPVNLPIVTVKFRAFVDLNTVLAVALVAILARALEAPRNIGTSGVLVAVVGFFLALVDLLPTVVASVAWFACALERAGKIGARGIIQTGRHLSQALVGFLADG